MHMDDAVALDAPRLDGFQERLAAAADPVGAGLVLYPGARYRPIASHGGAMTAQDGILMHVTTNHFDPYNFFSNTNNGASSTWWIGETVVGKCNCATPQDIVLCEQYYDALVKCWAQMAGNGLYQAAETSGTPDTPLSPAMVHTLAHLYAWGHKQPQLQWPLALTDSPGGRGFGWHGMGGVAYGNHPGCPGTPRRNQRQLIIAQAQHILAPGPTPGPTPTHDVAPRFLGLLATGSVGLPVHEWQQRMYNRGWHTVPGKGTPFVVDGKFGPNTLAVVEAFEKLLVKHAWRFVDAQHRVYTTTVDGRIGICVWHAAWDAPNLP